ncbi:MAG: hypothetical protein ACD_58C00121G0005 [uncultured bacterium]|nr:MAG: hypothetical protein ACD_58C00121G0005 [uncultured bacterium]
MFSIQQFFGKHLLIILLVIALGGAISIAAVPQLRGPVTDYIGENFGPKADVDQNSILTLVTNPSEISLGDSITAQAISNYNFKKIHPVSGINLCKIKSLSMQLPEPIPVRDLLRVKFSPYPALANNNSPSISDVVFEGNAIKIKIDRNGFTDPNYVSNAKPTDRVTSITWENWTTGGLPQNTAYSYTTDVLGTFYSPIYGNHAIDARLNYLSSECQDSTKTSVSYNFKVIQKPTFLIDPEKTSVRTNDIIKVNYTLKDGSYDLSSLYFYTSDNDADNDDGLISATKEGEFKAYSKDNHFFPSDNYFYLKNTKSGKVTINGFAKYGLNSSITADANVDFKSILKPTLLPLSYERKSDSKIINLFDDDSTIRAKLLSDNKFNPGDKITFKASFEKIEDDQNQDTTVELPLPQDKNNQAVMSYVNVSKQDKSEFNYDDVNKKLVWKYNKTDQIDNRLKKDQLADEEFQLQIGEDFNNYDFGDDGPVLKLKSQIKDDSEVDQTKWQKSDELKLNLDLPIPELSYYCPDDNIPYKKTDQDQGYVAGETSDEPSKQTCGTFNSKTVDIEANVKGEINLQVSNQNKSIIASNIKEKAKKGDDLSKNQIGIKVESEDQKIKQNLLVNLLIKGIVDEAANGKLDPSSISALGIVNPDIKLSLDQTNNGDKFKIKKLGYDPINRAGVLEIGMSGVSRKNKAEYQLGLGIQVGGESGAKGMLKFGLKTGITGTNTVKAGLGNIDFVPWEGVEYTDSKWSITPYYDDDSKSGQTISMAVENPNFVPYISGIDYIPTNTKEPKLWQRDIKLVPGDKIDIWVSIYEILDTISSETTLELLLPLSKNNKPLISFVSLINDGKLVDSTINKQFTYDKANNKLIWRYKKLDSSQLIKEQVQLVVSNDLDFGGDKPIIKLTTLLKNSLISEPNNIRQGDGEEISVKEIGLSHNFSTTPQPLLFDWDSFDNLDYVAIDQPNYLKNILNKFVNKTYAEESGSQSANQAANTINLNEDQTSYNMAVNDKGNFKITVKNNLQKDLKNKEIKIILPPQLYADIKNITPTANSKMDNQYQFGEIKLYLSKDDNQTITIPILSISKNANFTISVNNIELLTKLDELQSNIKQIREDINTFPTEDKNISIYLSDFNKTISSDLIWPKELAYNDSTLNLIAQNKESSFLKNINLRSIKNIFQGLFQTAIAQDYYGENSSECSNPEEFINTIHNSLSGLLNAWARQDSAQYAKYFKQANDLEKACSTANSMNNNQKYSAYGIYAERLISSMSSSDLQITTNAIVAYNNNIITVNFTKLKGMTLLPVVALDFKLPPYIFFEVAGGTDANEIPSSYYTAQTYNYTSGKFVSTYNIKLYYKLLNINNVESKIYLKDQTKDQIIVSNNDLGLKNEREDLQNQIKTAAQVAMHQEAKNQLANIQNKLLKNTKDLEDNIAKISVDKSSDLAIINNQIDMQLSDLEKPENQPKKGWVLSSKVNSDLIVNVDKYNNDILEKIDKEKQKYSDIFLDITRNKKNIIVFAIPLLPKPMVVKYKTSFDKDMAESLDNNIAKPLNNHFYSNLSKLDEYLAATKKINNEKINNLKKSIALNNAININYSFGNITQSTKTSINNKSIIGFRTALAEDNTTSLVDQTTVKIEAKPNIEMGKAQWDRNYSDPEDKKIKIIIPLTTNFASSDKPATLNLAIDNLPTEVITSSTNGNVSLEQFIAKNNKDIDQIVTIKGSCNGITYQSYVKIAKEHKTEIELPTPLVGEVLINGIKYLPGQDNELYPEDKLQIKLLIGEVEENINNVNVDLTLPDGIAEKIESQKVDLVAGEEKTVTFDIKLKDEIALDIKTVDITPIISVESKLDKTKKVTIKGNELKLDLWQKVVGNVQGPWHELPNAYVNILDKNNNEINHHYEYIDNQGNKKTRDFNLTDDKGNFELKINRNVDLLGDKTNFIFSLCDGPKSYDSKLCFITGLSYTKDKKNVYYNHISAKLDQGLVASDLNKFIQFNFNGTENKLQLINPDWQEVNDWYASFEVYYIINKAKKFVYQKYNIDPAALYISAMFAGTVGITYRLRIKYQTEDNYLLNKNYAILDVNGDFVFDDKDKKNGYYPEMILHEMGHYFMDNIYDKGIGALDKGDYNHFGYFNGSSRDSLEEGWAYFFAVYLKNALWPERFNNDLTFKDIYGDEYNQNISNAYLPGFYDVINFDNYSDNELSIFTGNNRDRLYATEEYSFASYLWNLTHPTLLDKKVWLPEITYNKDSNLLDLKEIINILKENSSMGNIYRFYSKVINSYPGYKSNSNSEMTSFDKLTLLHGFGPVDHNWKKIIYSPDEVGLNSNFEYKYKVPKKFTIGSTFNLSGTSPKINDLPSFSSRTNREIEIVENNSVKINQTNKYGEFANNIVNLSVIYNSPYDYLNYQNNLYINDNLLNYIIPYNFISSKSYITVNNSSDYLIIDNKAFFNLLDQNNFQFLVEKTFNIQSADPSQGIPAATPPTLEQMQAMEAEKEKKIEEARKAQEDQARIVELEAQLAQAKADQAKAEEDKLLAQQAADAANKAKEGALAMAQAQEQARLDAEAQLAQAQAKIIEQEKEITRLNGVIADLESQLAQLRVDAEAAKKDYQDKIDSLVKLQNEKFTSVQNDYNTAKDKLLTDYSTLLDQKQELVRAQEDLQNIQVEQDKKIADLTKQLSDKDTRINQLTTKFDEKTQLADKYALNIQNLQRELTEQQTNSQTFQAIITRLKLELIKAQEAINSYQLNSLVYELANEDYQSKYLETKLALVKSQNQVEEITNKYLEGQKVIKDLTTEIQSLESKVNNLTDQATLYQSQLDKLNTKLSDSYQRETELSNQNTDFKAKLASTTSLWDKLKLEYDLAINAYQLKLTQANQKNLLNEQELLLTKLDNAKLQLANQLLEQRLKEKEQELQLAQQTKTQDELNNQISTQEDLFQTDNSILDEEISKKDDDLIKKENEIKKEEDQLIKAPSTQTDNTTNDQTTSQSPIIQAPTIILSSQSTDNTQTSKSTKDLSQETLASLEVTSSTNENNLPIVTTNTINTQTPKVNTKEDDLIIDAKNFTLAKEVTIQIDNQDVVSTPIVSEDLTLKVPKDKLNNLSIGDHTVTIKDDLGNEASTDFKVTQNQLWNYLNFKIAVMSLLIMIFGATTVKLVFGKIGAV